MRKQIVIGMLCLLMTVFTACGGGEDVSIDLQAVGDALNAEVAFTDTLTQIPSESAVALYGLDAEAVVNAVVFVSSGATAEEFALWEAADSAGVEAIIEAATLRMASQAENYADYKPAEVPKLENFILKKQGNYVVLCASDDNETAETVLAEYGF